MIQEGQQRTLDWFRQRMGCFTGSKISDLMKAGRKKDEPWSETAKSYMAQIAGERLFTPDLLADDEAFEGYVQQTSVSSKAIQWGIDNEDAAKRIFMATYHPDKQLDEVETCTHDTIPHFAASPDGILRNADGQGNDFILEVKCPSIGVYVQYRAAIHDAATLKAVKPEYYWQMMAEMACSGTRAGIFIVYCPWLSDMHTALILRDDDDTTLMEQRITAANAYVDALMERCTAQQEEGGTQP